MNKQTFPWIAIFLGLVLLGGLFFSGAIPPSDHYALPLLLLLFMSELGALISAAGAYGAGRNWLENRANTTAIIAALLAAALTVTLAVSGVMIWQHSMPAGAS